MMSGVGTADLAAPGGVERARLVRSTVLFVAGFTVVFAAFEATASGVSQTLRAHQQLLDEVAGAAIVAMGLVFAGLARPGWLVQERRCPRAALRLGPWAAPVMGMAFAFGWTPCIGPALGAVISLASSSHTLGRGELMLVAFSLGLGVPFVVLGWPSAGWPGCSASPAGTCGSSTWCRDWSSPPSASCCSPTTCRSSRRSSAVCSTTSASTAWPRSEGAPPGDRRLVCRDRSWLALRGFPWVR